MDMKKEEKKEGRGGEGRGEGYERGRGRGKRRERRDEGEGAKHRLIQTNKQANKHGSKGLKSKTKRMNRQQKG